MAPTKPISFNVDFGVERACCVNGAKTLKLNPSNKLATWIQQWSWVGSHCEPQPNVCQAALVIFTLSISFDKINTRCQKQSGWSCSNCSLSVTWLIQQVSTKLIKYHYGSLGKGHVPFLSLLLRLGFKRSDLVQLMYFKETTFLLLNLVDM